MDSRKPLSESSEDEEYSSDEESSTVSEVDSDTTSSDENVDVAFLLVDTEIEEAGVLALVDEAEKECMGPYKVIEGLMQPKVEASKKQELMVKMLSLDLSIMEKEQYVKMLSGFPELFITSYEEIRGLKGEELHIELREGVKIVCQRLRRIGQD